MENSSEIIDKDFVATEPRITTNTRFRAIIYLVIMLAVGVGFIYYKYKFRTLDPDYFKAAFSDSSIFIFQALILSLILETFRCFFRKRKFKKTGIISKADPFWFQVIEGAFALWIVLIVILVLITMTGLYY